MTHIYVYLFLAALVVLFPNDALLFPRWLGSQIQLHYVNAKCFVQSYLFWRKMKKEFGPLGFPVPPFNYIHIWDRNEP